MTNFWPNWPVLPIKRYSKEEQLPRTALLYDCAGDEDTEDRKIRFLDNAILGLAKRRDLQNAPIADIDKLVTDGWRVD